MVRGMLHEYLHFIDGRYAKPHLGEWFESYNPTTGAAWARIPNGDAVDVDVAVRAANEAMKGSAWGSMSASGRGALLRRLGDLIARDAGKLAETEVRDNGKLLAEMYGQVSYVPQWFYYFGGLADKIQGEVLPLDKKGFLNFTRYEPVGVVGIITPWNSPLLLLAWKLAPALAAGCAVVVKPSEHAAASTLEFAALINEAGFPPGVVNVVTGQGNTAGDALVKHPLVRKIAFTGSDTTGAAIGSAAGGQLKRATLELGGKSANIVFADAKLEDALNGVISGIFAATGQTCVAGSRLLLHDSIYDEFLRRLVARAKGARIGDPMRGETNVGPITTLAQYQKVLRYIDIGKTEGATVELGGRAASPRECAGGWFVEPTIFGNVTSKMRIGREEIFGPVLAVMKFSDDEEAVALANDSPYGLAAGIWTQDVARGIRVAERMAAGIVWVNCYRTVSFMSPFGGIKRSGIGRENGIDSIYEYLEVKSVWLNIGAAVANPFILG